ncbi:hypothetical protein F5B20DRAFT_594025 [Whalleya microplaca]|nr:hypothetical protein F5B20DRAFT_594025 [Whalleya microplaca]
MSSPPAPKPQKTTSVTVNVADCGDEDAAPDYYSPPPPRTPPLRTDMTEKQGKLGAVLLPPAGWDSVDLSRFPASTPLSRDRQSAAAPALLLGSGRQLPRVPLSFGPERARTGRGRPGPFSLLQSIWANNKAPFLIILSQLFGALMNLLARLLELEGEGEGGGMHPMQLLFLRMVISVAGSTAYIWWARIPHGVLGRADVRWLLAARGVCGFFGIYGMWYSAMYLPLAEATVITFLSPNIAGYMCHVLIHDPFTRKEQLASFLALAGVVLITRPDSLFSGGGAGKVEAAVVVEGVANATAAAAAGGPSLDHVPTSAERLGAIGMGLLGMLGGAGAITSLRWIGPRAHPLISTNYFSLVALAVTTTTLTLAPALDYGQPELRVVLPGSVRQWVFVLLVVACGVILQVCTAVGLAVERSNRATAMIYTHMLFAAGFDYFVFGHSMGAVSAVGAVVIVGSALWVALTKGEGEGKGALGLGGGERGRDVEGGRGGGGGGGEDGGVESESVPMLDDVDIDDGQDLVLDRFK